MSLTVKEYITWVHNGSLDPQKMLWTYVEKAKSHDRYNAFVRLHDDYVADHAHDLFSLPLAGTPIGVKDIFMTQWYETTCCSTILQWYIPGYSSSVFTKLEQAWCCMIGKTNMDEFAMGWSNEHSFFWPVCNPYDEERISGGSSWWSAAAVAADLCLAALGTDTGGSIREPASFCGVVGTKGTYGRTSRYGVQAMASSLDHIGVFTKTVEDAVLMMQTMSGKDEHDATTIETTEEERVAWNDALTWDSLHGKHFALPRERMDEGIDPQVKKTIESTVAFLRTQWAIIDSIDLPLLKSAIAAYYVLCPAEVSTNMARFDGVRFGLQGDTAWHDRIHDYYAAIRSQWFGDEVKRRILTGAYVLSAGFYDAYYRKAVGVRNQMRAQCNALFWQYDAIIGPTVPVLPWKIGSNIDPVQEYLLDLCTIPANLTGTPAMSVPCGFAEIDGKKLPIGFQIMTKYRDEATMFGVARVVERMGREEK